ncbi:glutamate-cysteine ligase family protein [Oscillatoria sp. FACHB-1406]|uniref:glutamate-cysteine ligase family protein n=1 Tax=Oscillatoria sp. FACHB-1406 TaxID=2692846 RepID=UPI001688957B|nr:glutamate-cysteine ligase family protein [Oscillatoria sp. FACHB-1406]MBD2579913.1 glutamate--cysteine ligase [Oscillatoria sp. FACHB-1406]
MFSFGIEHEVAFLNARGQFADFTCTQFQEFDRIIEQLPTYTEDYPQLRVGDAGIKKKRWYIEGIERFSEAGKMVACVPKGIEIRTTIHSTIEGAIAELEESFARLREVALQHGFTPVLISFNPNYTSYEPQPPFNRYEQARRESSPEKRTESIPMLTYGPDLNLSIAGMPKEGAIDIARKLTYYSPYIVPFSFSSPFYDGQLWEGLSARTYLRTGARPAAMVFLEFPEDLISSDPSLTKIARLPAEVGRIEFKAFDSCDDFQLYAALLTLLKGIALDRSLPGRATTPDRELHQISALQGFADAKIFDTATQVLQAAEQALEGDSQLLQPLHALLERRETPAHRLLRAFEQFGSVEQTLKHTYR